ncbi:Putative Holin-X, holin superfamily III [Agrococcus baldri]|uniref:Holin-X, holin superfamily III n=1 Tax=Agrococcus baldri TaxID=153730 RepID=A0AA94HM65_9MICO|nr:phage holin family protein [Agrococcus baldri]SFS09827.1 Putative Holin-X, holin superfamily III [Agrococcus baldri]
MASRKSLGDLIAETPKLLTDLVKAEIDNLKSEVAGKAKGLGIGGALLAVAGVLAIFLISWLLYAGYEGLNVVFVPWLSALLISALLLLVILILVLVGLSAIKKNKDFNNLQAVDSIKDDVNMVRGLGHAADGTDPLDDLDRNAFDANRVGTNPSSTNGVQR